MRQPPRQRRIAEATSKTGCEPETTPITSPVDIVMESVPELTASLLEGALADQEVDPMISTPAAPMPELEPSVQESRA